MVAALGTNSTFFCAAVGPIVWQIGDIQIIDEMRMNAQATQGIFAPVREDNSSSLTITGREDNNNTIVRCLVFPVIGGVRNMSEQANFINFGELCVRRGLHESGFCWSRYECVWSVSVVILVLETFYFAEC